MNSKNNVDDASFKYLVLKSKSGYCKNLSLTTSQFLEIVNFFPKNDIDILKQKIDNNQLRYTITLLSKNKRF